CCSQDCRVCIPCCPY
nr:RecName: Full=Conotoxin Fi3a; AltName: Full=Conotoxin Fi3b [Conus figulinus]